MSNEENTTISTDQEVTNDSVEESTILTDEQVKEVYDSLNEADNMNSLEKLAAAEEETENSNYEEIEEIPEFVQDEAEVVLPENVVKESILSYDLGITDDDAVEFAKVILQYRADKSIKVYDLLPPSTKTIVDSIIKNVNTPMNKTNKISKENAARFFIDQFITDAELQVALDEFNTSINGAFNEMDTELSKLFNEAYDEEFGKIEEYKETEPEKAERIETVKKAFENAKPPFPMINVWIDNNNVRKIIYKMADLRFRDETGYFNSKVNVTDVKVPDIRELVDIIKLHDPTKSDIEIKRFVIAICRHVYNQDFTELGNIAYIYRLVDSIYKYKFISPAIEDEHHKEIFEAISAVIDKINSL